MSSYVREPNRQSRVERGEAAMTWIESGRALGYKNAEAGRRAAFMIYKEAMRKIRNRPHSIERLRQLVEFRNAQRKARTPMPDWDA
jgi:hypothetical protein